MKSAPYFPFWAKDWRSSESVTLMSLAERGAFIELLAVAWLSSAEPCTIPSADEEISALLRVSVDEWRQIAPRVLAEFDETVAGSRLRNGKLYNEFRAMQAKHRKQSVGGKRGAAKRWDTHRDSHSQPNAEPLPVRDRVIVKDTDKKPTTRRKRRDGVQEPWLLPSCAVWESRKGAGTFPWAKAGSALKRLHEAGHPDDRIAGNLGRYLDKTEAKYHSFSRFAETFADYDLVRLSGPAVVDSWLSPEVDRLTAPAGMVA